MVGIKLETEKKYMILAEKQRQGYPVNFDVLYYAKNDDFDYIDSHTLSGSGFVVLYCVT